MKKIILLLGFLFTAFFVFAQHPVGTDSFALQTLGSINTLLKSKGAIGSDSGFVNAHFLDTTAANRSKISHYPGAQIMVVNNIWIRNTTASKWIQISGSSNTSGGIDTAFALNDSTLRFVKGVDSFDVLFTLVIPNLSAYMQYGDTSAMLDFAHNKMDTAYISSGNRNDTLYGQKNGIPFLIGITQCPVGLVAGTGLVTWFSGLTFDATASIWYDQDCNRYTDTAGRITLDPADATFGRWDIIGGDTLGNIIKVTGTPAAAPGIPVVGEGQIAYAAYFIPQNATTPSGVSELVVYNQNTGAPEWPGTATWSSSVNFGGLTNPFIGTITTDAGSFVSGNSISYTKSTGTVNAVDYTTLKFYLRLKASFGKSTNLSVTFLNGTTVVSSPITLGAAQGFSKTVTGSYQNISIPFSTISFTAASFNKIKFTTAGSNASGFYLDYVTLQTGNTTPSTGSFVSRTFRKAGTDSVFDVINGVNVFSHVINATGLTNITGLVTAGSNVTVTGSGTSGSPYVVNSSAGGTGTVTNVTGTAPVIITGTSTVTPNVTVDTTKSIGRLATFSDNALKFNITDTANIRLRPIAGTNVTITGTYPNLTFNSSGSGSGTAVDTLYRTANKDSIQHTIGSRYHAIADSTGNTFVVDYVGTAWLPAYSYSAGVITETANGALPNQDSITPVAGHRILLWREITAANNGVYVVTQLGSAGTPFILTRLINVGSRLAAGSKVDVQKGYTYAGRTFNQTTTGTITIGTTALYYLPVVIPPTNNNLIAGNNPGHITYNGVNAAHFSTLQAQSLYLPSNATLQGGATDLTFSAWVLHDSLTSRPQVIINKDDDLSSQGSEYLMGYYPAYGSYVFQVETLVSTTKYIASTSGTPEVGKWHFVIGWYDHTLGRVYIQVDNGKVDSLTGVDASTHVGNTMFAIGAVGSAGSVPDNTGTFDGAISSVGFWKRVLTKSERSTLFKLGTASNVNTVLTNATRVASVPSSLASNVYSTLFNGTSSILTIPQVSMRAAISSLSFWVKPVAFGGIVFGRSTSSAPYIAIQTSTVVRIQNDLGSAFVDFTVPTMSTGTWYNIIVIRDASSNTHVYLNGTESSSGGQAMITHAITINQIGAYWDNAHGANLSANLSQVMFFPYDALGAGDIASIAAGTATSFSPYYLYKLNEASGSIVFNYTGILTGDFKNLPPAMLNESRSTFISYWPLTEVSGTRYDRWNAPDSSLTFQLDTIPLATFGGGGGNAGDTAAFTTSTIYGSFFNKYTDTLVITSMMIVMQGTSDTATVDVVWNDSLNTGTLTHLKTAYTPVNNNITGTEVTSFDNTKIPPGNFVWCKTPAIIAGRKPTYLSVTLLGYKIRKL